MGKIKVRKIGNSVGAIFPKEWGLHEGDVLNYERNGTQYILEVAQSVREHDRQLIEKSFAEFERKNAVSEKEMVEQFGKYGWGE